MWCLSTSNTSHVCSSGHENGCVRFACEACTDHNVCALIWHLEASIVPKGQRSAREKDFPAAAMHCPLYLWFPCEIQVRDSAREWGKKQEYHDYLRHTYKAVATCGTRTRTHRSSRAEARKTLHLYRFLAASHAHTHARMHANTCT